MRRCGLVPVFQVRDRVAERYRERALTDCIHDLECTRRPVPNHIGTTLKQPAASRYRQLDVCWYERSDAWVPHPGRPRAEGRSTPSDELRLTFPRLSNTGHHPHPYVDVHRVRGRLAKSREGNKRRGNGKR